MLLGLRRFDAVNLAYGAAAGDLALAEVAARLRISPRPSSTGRWLARAVGGGNFLLVADEACSRERWQLFAEQLADAVAAADRRAEPARCACRRASRCCAGSRGEDAEAMLDRLGQALAAMRASGPAARLGRWRDDPAGAHGGAARGGPARARSTATRSRSLFQPQFAAPTTG